MNDLVRALGRTAEQQGHSVLVVEGDALLSRATEKSGERLSENDQRHPQSVGLLIVENFGTHKLSPRQIDQFTQLVTARLGQASTIITSPLLLNQWASLLEGSKEAKELHQALLRKASQVVIGGNGKTREKSLR